MADDEDFQTAVTVADVDGVGIAVVLNERDELISAARIARAIVTNRRREEERQEG